MFRTLRNLSVSAALLLGAAAAHAPAGASDSKDGEGRPVVEVLEHGWKRHVHSPWLETANWYVEPEGQDVKGFQYRVVIRNNARRAVRAVEWDYRFVRPADGSVVSLHHFKSPAKLKPGGVRKLNAFSVRPPTNSVDAAAAGADGRPGLVEQVAIRAVVFEDGSRQTF